MMNKQSLVVGLLLERLADSKVGILVKGINGIQPDEIAAELSSQRKTHIYMAAVGYGISTDVEKSEYTLTPSIEKAVLWRSVPEYAGNIVVFVKTDTDKLHSLAEFDVISLNSVYTRSGQNSTPNSNATNLHSSQKRCCSFCISSSNASPTFQVQKSIFHQMTKPIQVTVILPLLLAISFSRNDDIHSSISGISNDLIGVIPTIGQ